MFSPPAVDKQTPLSLLYRTYPPQIQVGNLSYIGVPSLPRFRAWSPFLSPQSQETAYLLLFHGIRWYHCHPIEYGNPHPEAPSPIFRDLRNFSIVHKRDTIHPPLTNDR